MTYKSYNEKCSYEILKDLGQILEVSYLTQTCFFYKNSNIEGTYLV